MRMPKLRAALLLPALMLWAAPAAFAAPTPDEVIRDNTEEVLRALDERRDEFQRDPDALHAMVRERSEALFDTQRISRLILGRHYRGAEPQQVERFITEFREFLIRTYSVAVFEVGDITVDYLPVVYSKDRKKALVKTVLKLPAAAEPITLHYKLNETRDGDWKVYEVTVNGVSLITNYRTIYDSVIRDKGLDGLITELAARNADAASAQ